MNDCMKLKIAIADAMVEQLWKKGIITKEERDRISAFNHAELQNEAA